MFLALLFARYQTVDAVKGGVVELKQAEKFQKSARPVKCMLVLMVREECS